MISSVISTRFPPIFCFPPIFLTCLCQQVAAYEQHCIAPVIVVANFYSRLTRDVESPPFFKAWCFCSGIICPKAKGTFCMTSLVIELTIGVFRGVYRFKALNQRFSTCGQQPPRGSPDDLPGVGSDLRKFVNKVVSV